MPQYQVDSEQIQSSSAAVNASVAAIRQAVNGMYANLNALQGVWRGSAASLESIQRALASASTLYADAEAQASRLFAG